MKDDRIKLYGFNNLTKSLSFNIYDVCYAQSDKEQQEYVAYIDECYNSAYLTSILKKLTDMIGAHILHISTQDYEPQGSSVVLMLSEEHLNPQPILAHLDKSHVTVHTYPESHPEQPVVTFRVDISVETCGEISPLRTLDYLISCFDSDIITMDYKVRGFTRDLQGKKLFIDQDFSSITDSINPLTLARYETMDINAKEINQFHTKMLLKEFDLQNYLFHRDVQQLPVLQRQEIELQLRKEMQEIYRGQQLSPQDLAS